MANANSLRRRDSVAIVIFGVCTVILLSVHTIRVTMVDACFIIIHVFKKNLDWWTTHAPTCPHAECTHHGRLPLNPRSQHSFAPHTSSYLSFFFLRFLNTESVTGTSTIKAKVSDRQPWYTPPTIENAGHTEEPVSIQTIASHCARKEIPGRKTQRRKS